MTQYAILIYAAAQPGTAEEHRAHADSLLKSGAMRAAFALESVEMATTIRADTVTDGPFVDVKEVIAGICIIEAADLDAAIDIARDNPAVKFGGAVEIRPVTGSVVVPQ